MTSHDASASDGRPAPGTQPARRRALGRGPGTAPDRAEPEAGEQGLAASAPMPEPEPAGEDALPGRMAEDALLGNAAGSEAAGADVSARADEPGPDGALARSAAGPEADGTHVPAEADEPGADGALAGRATEPEVGGTDVSAEATAVPAEDEQTGPGPLTVATHALSGGGAAPEGGPVQQPGAGDVAVTAGAAGAAGPGPVEGDATSSDAGGDGDGRFKVRLPNFEGPFDLLLQLIAKHKLDVTEVALSKVTDEFMAYIRAMGPDWDLDETTEFLVVAATLLDLKAARLLPAAEVEDEADLALLEARDLLFARLLQYRAYKQIADIFSRRLDDEARRYPRTVGLEPQHADLLPEVVISIGPEGFARLAVKAMQPKPKPQVYVDHIHAPLVSVQEQAGIVVARLRELGEASFRALIEDTDDTLTVVARFLALLELYREKAVALEQETALGELLVRWTGGEGDARPRVTDEFDRPPEKAGEEKKP